MRRRSREGRVLKWTCTVACVLALALPLGRNCYARWRFTGLWWRGGPAAEQAAELFAMFTAGAPGVVSWSDSPYYAASAAFAILGGYLWYRDRQVIPLGHCQNCGYDLTGNVSGICPECGTPVPAARTPKASG